MEETLKCITSVEQKLTDNSPLLLVPGEQSSTLQVLALQLDWSNTGGLLLLSAISCLKEFSHFLAPLMLEGSLHRISSLATLSFCCLVFVSLQAVLASNDVGGILLHWASAKATPDVQEMFSREPLNIFLRAVYWPPWLMLWVGWFYSVASGSCWQVSG